MENIRFHWRLYLANMRASLLSQLEYPLNLVSWLIGTPIYYLAGVWMIFSISDQFGGLGGYQGDEIIFLYGLGLVSQGIMITFFIQSWGMDYMVRQGGFDRYLLRPVSVVFQFCTSTFNCIGVVDMIPGLIIFGYGCKAVHFVWSFWNIVKLFAAVAGAVLIRMSAFGIIGTLSFWTKSTAALRQSMSTVLEKTTMYPISLYPTVLQMLFTFLVPLGFISFYPSADFLRKSGGLQLPLGYALLTPLVGLLMAAFNIWLFHRGMRRYESAGS